MCGLALTIGGEGAAVDSEGGESRMNECPPLAPPLKRREASRARVKLRASASHDRVLRWARISSRVTVEGDEKPGNTSSFAPRAA